MGNSAYQEFAHGSLFHASLISSQEATPLLNVDRLTNDSFPFLTSPVAAARRAIRSSPPLVAPPGHRLASTLPTAYELCRRYPLPPQPLRRSLKPLRPLSRLSVRRRDPRNRQTTQNQNNTFRLLTPWFWLPARKPISKPVKKKNASITSSSAPSSWVVLPS